MRKVSPLFFAIIFSLFLIPFVQASTICDNSFCLTYVASYTTDQNQLMSIDYVNDSFYVTHKTHYFFEFNESFLTVDTVGTVDEWGHALEFGNGWNRDSGYFSGSRSFAGSNYFGKWNFTPAELLWTNKGRQYESGGDWYNNYYWIIDDNGQIYKMDEDFNEISGCSVPAYSTGAHHLNNTDRIMVALANTNEIYLFDESCNQKAVIDLDGFGVGVSSSMGVTGNDNNTKIWVVDYRSPSVVYEFDVNLSFPYTALIPTSPIESDAFVNDIIVMELDLNAGLNGTLNCYVNDVLTHTDTYENGTYSIDFSSGNLPDGENTWLCNFTDSESFVWGFDLITFDVATGIMNSAGNSLADLFGFATDDYSTKTQKGKGFLAIIISLSIALGVGGYLKNSGEMAGITFVAMLIIFTYTGDLPAWIGILLIIISGFIVVEWLKKAIHK